jgi:exopolysaccharide biosynthesis polyprenyl glycosylphosphotransferase
MQKSRSLQTIWLLAIPSVLLFFLSLFVSIHLRYPQNFVMQWQRHIRAFSPVYIIWLLVMFAHNLFDIRILRRYIFIIFSLISAITVCFISAVVYFYFQPDLILTPRRFLLLHSSFTYIFLVIWYILVKVFFARRSPEKIYIFGSVSQDLAQEIKNHAYLGYVLAGYVSESDLKPELLGVQSSIILPDEIKNSPELFRKFYELRKNQIGFYGQHDFYERLMRRIDTSLINEYWFLENVNYQAKRFYGFVKRLFDIFFGLSMLILFLATWPFLAIAIKLTSHGSLLFIQERVGQNGSIFKVYKYRTMVNGRGDTWTQNKDPRITTVGKFLRRSRLDELPQCINLLQGNMSLVGPRPEQVHIVEMLKKEIPFFDERHLVKPGLTGWAQLNIYASSLEETKVKLQYDLYYIKNQSIFLDLEIILKTFYHIVTGKGR